MYVCTIFDILDEVYSLEQENKRVSDKLCIGCHGRKLTNKGVY